MVTNVEALACERIDLHCFKLFQITLEETEETHMLALYPGMSHLSVKLVSLSLHSDNDTYRYVTGMVWIVYVESIVSR